MTRKNNISQEERLRMAEQLRINCRDVTPADKARAGRIGGPIGGRIGGRTSGRMNVESGHLARVRTPEHQRAAGRLGGKIGGKINGRRAADLGKAQQLACIRWHRNRGIVSAKCRNCNPKKIFTAAHAASITEQN
jgi:hypothetical protein